MKSRIGKLEGDGRTAKRLQESLGKHVKILENALRREREKAKAPPPPVEEITEGKKDQKEGEKDNLKAGSKRRSTPIVLRVSANLEC